MSSDKRFKTKTGFCHILSDRIILTRDGDLGNIAKVTVGHGITRILILYGIISLGSVYFSVNYFKSKQYFSALIFILLALYLIYGIINSKNNSATPVIQRNSIKTIKFNRGIVGFTRARFEVFFIDESGKLKKRLIMLPGSLSGGQDETEIAYKFMQEENLI